LIAGTRPASPAGDGRVAQAPAERTLAWEGCFNVRDLGGLATADGRLTRRGALIRSDLLVRLSPAGRQALIAHGVRTIVDVRFPEEVAKDWDGYPFKPDGSDVSDPVAYVNAPFRTPLAEEGIRLAYERAKSRSELNLLDLESGATGIAGIVAAIADASPGGVVVHCHAGKDRTGIVVALLLALVGVSDEAIADDYALTAANIEPLIIEWLKRTTDDEYQRVRLRDLAMPARETMLDTLAHVRRRYGSAESYLRAAGVTDDPLSRLRARLIEEG
jgi:protein tyrosine/serine phosphatase